MEIWLKKSRNLTPLQHERLKLNILHLTKKGLRQSEIGKLVNRSSVYVRQLQQELADQDKLKINQQTGYVEIEKPKTDLVNFQNADRESFEKIPTIQKWIELKSQSNKGKGLVKIGTYTSHILTFCNTLKIHPDIIVYGLDDQGNSNYLERLANCMMEFQKHLDQGTAKYQSKRIKKGADIIEYTRAWSSLLTAHQKPIPSRYGGKDHILSKSSIRRNYSTIFLNDQQFEFGLSFTNAFGPQMQALYALQHEMITRTDSVFSWNVDYIIKTISIDGQQFRYAEIPNFYEKKTKSTWTKLVINSSVLKILESLPRGKPIIENPNAEHKARYYAMLRKLFVRLGLIEENQKYSLGTKEWFLHNKPSYVLRHSGAHLWLRRFNFRFEFVAKLGWESIDTLSKFYASQSFDSIFNANKCDICNNTKSQDLRHYCSIQHAIKGES